MVCRCDTQTMFLTRSVVFLHRKYSRNLEVSISTLCFPYRLNRGELWVLAKRVREHSHVVRARAWLA